MYVYIHLHVYVYLYACAYWGQKRGTQNSWGNWSYRWFEATQLGCWGLNLGPLEAQEPCLYSPPATFTSERSDFSQQSSNSPPLTLVLAQPLHCTVSAANPTPGPSKDENTIPVPCHTCLSHDSSTLRLWSISSNTCSLSTDHLSIQMLSNSGSKTMSTVLYQHVK